MKGQIMHDGYMSYGAQSWDPNALTNTQQARADRGFVRTFRVSGLRGLPARIE